MESSTNTEDVAESVSGDSNISLEDTFITLQTKGHSSQKIPLSQFLEKVMGGKLDSDIKLKTMSLLMAGDTPSTLNETCGTQEQIPDHSFEMKESGKPFLDNEITKINHEIKGVDVSENDIPRKSKRRGRPRKVQAEAKDEEIVLNACSSSAFLQMKRNNLLPSKVKDQPAATPSLRRSSRVPAKNSRFKDDFVDSSVITSKSTSGDTRLMTLALAAECHTTKPNKQAIPLKKTHSGSADHFSSASKCVTQKVILTVDDGNTEEKKYTQKVANIDLIDSQAGEPSPVQKCPLPDNILKRSLLSQLNLHISNTYTELSDKPTQINMEKEDVFSSPTRYYVLTEPKAKFNCDGLLVHKYHEGIKFRTVDISGNVYKEQATSVSDVYPHPRYFECDLCEKVFLTTTQWQLHYKQAHSQKPVDASRKSSTTNKVIYSCKQCNQKFPFKFMLDNHLQKQNKCNTSNCLVCNQTFSSQNDLDEHMTLAHPIKQCLVCGKHFDDIVALRRHATNDCKDKLLTHDLNLNYTGKVLEMEDKISVNSLVKTEKPLTGQEEEVFRQREDCEMYEVVTDFESVDKSGAKVECELCGWKFSTFSGLWYHKLENHQEFFPSGFKEKLEARLEKTQQLLSSVSLSNDATAMETKNKSHYFVVMKPKWYSKLKLKVSMENKKFNFSSVASKPDNAADENLASGQPVSLVQKGVVFYCIQCCIYYESASAYREHKSEVHNECFETIRYLGAFQCTYCSDTFPCQFMLNKHIKQHNGGKLLPCTLCGLTFHKIQERRQHWKQVHPGVGCPNCGKMYASIKYLQKHISLNCQDHYPATKKFIAFRKKQHNDFQMDEKDKRVEKKIIKCHLCSKICSSVHGWRRHMSENHEDEGFSKLSNTCIMCNEVIYGYKALEKHLLEVHAEESGLPIEEENIIVKEALEKSKMRIQDYQKAGKSNANVYQDEEGMFHCPECPKTHSDLKALTIHIKTHVNMQLECSICKKSFKNPTLLKQHVMRHRTTAVYDCETCGKKFMTLQKLNKHNKVHHSKESFVCELCGMSFALNDYLLKHKKCHTDKRPHLCSVCGKTFRTKPELRVHILIHTQETPYVCEHCGRGFTQKGNWRIHLAQHTGAKPHKCNLCELSFALPSHLKRHLLTHNQKINYRCMWCDKECTQRKHMQMHVSRVHKEDFFQYEEQMKLENPVPIASSQMKIYNRRLGKSGQVRKAYRTRAKKCNSSIQDILDGVPKIEATEEEILESDVVIKPMIETNEETVTSDISISNQDMTADNMHILVSEDHHNYVKHDIPAGLIEEDGSNIEIVMGDNNEINIIINNAENAISTDLALQDGLDESGPVSLTHFTDASGQLTSSLQQAVNALVAGQKGEDADGDDGGLPLDMDAMITGDNYTIVYPSGS